MSHPSTNCWSQFLSLSICHYRHLLPLLNYPWRPTKASSSSDLHLLIRNPLGKRRTARSAPSPVSVWPSGAGRGFFGPHRSPSATRGPPLPLEGGAGAGIALLSAAVQADLEEVFIPDCVTGPIRSA